MPTVASLFDSQVGAENAVNDLDRLGVKTDHIRVLSQADLNRNEGILGALADAFNAGDNEVSSTLMRLGMSREEAEFFSKDLDQDAVLLVVDAERDMEGEVLELLRRAGGRAHAEA